jgi:hypothetical protein
VALVLATIESHASRVAHQTGNNNQQAQSQQYRDAQQQGDGRQHDLDRSDATFGEESLEHMEGYSARGRGSTAEQEDQEEDDQSVSTRTLPPTVSALVAECERDEQRGTASAVRSPVPQPAVVAKYTSALLQGSVNTTDSGESSSAVSNKPKSMNRRKRLFDESSDED